MQYRSALHLISDITKKKDIDFMFVDKDTLGKIMEKGKEIVIAKNKREFRELCLNYANEEIYRRLKNAQAVKKVPFRLQ